jgi:hypothetical protein
MGMTRRFGKDKTWTGNEHAVLKKLFADTYTDSMSNEAMNTLVEKYADSTKFTDRLRKFTVQRWTKSKNVPFEDMLVDWLELKLVTPEIVDNSIQIKKYEDSVAVNEFIEARKLEMDAKAETFKKQKKIHNF